MTVSDTIWMYWEDPPGSDRAPYLSVCLETVVRHANGLRVKVLDRDTAFEYLPGLDPETWNRLPDAVRRADYLRTRLAHRYGGLWLDFDVIAVSSLMHVFARLDGHETLGWGRELRGNFYNGLFAATAGSPFVARWIEGQDEVLRDTERWDALPWGALGQDIVRPLSRRMPPAWLPMDVVAPVPWYASRQFGSRLASPRRILRANPITVMLWNTAMPPTIRRMSRDDLLGANLLISRLFRVALGISSAEAAESISTLFDPFTAFRYSRSGRRVGAWSRRISSVFDRRLRETVP